METLPLDQQKKAILYAPKELLWKIMEEETAWLKIFKILPDEYFESFLAGLRRLGVTEAEKVRAHAETYVRDRVRYDHLQKALVKVWSPSDLEEATSWLKENGFLGRPLMPLNLQAAKAILREAAAVPKATRARYARRAGGKGPKVGYPPENASKSAIKLWNRVMRDSSKRRMIKKPKSVGDQWALAVKFWLQECARQKCQPYKSDAGRSSHSMHAHNVIERAMTELANGLSFEGYSMARPAARKFKELWRQLEKDGVELKKWKSIRPKKRIK
jgi:hypothetical protein